MILSFLSFSFLLFFAACDAAPASKSTDEAETEIPVADGTDEESASAEKTGLVQQVEDAGYPFFSLLLFADDTGVEEWYWCNVEAMPDMDADALVALEGKMVQLSYSSSTENALLDLRYEGNSVLGVADGDLPEGLQRLTGILSGTYTYEGGDLPGKISVSDPHEAVAEFEFFVTQEMKDLEGQIVEAWYDVRTINRVQGIRPL